MMLDRRRRRKTRRNRPPLAFGVEPCAGSRRGPRKGRSCDAAPFFAGGGRSGSIKGHSSSAESFPNRPRTVCKLSLGGLVPRHFLYPFVRLLMAKYATSWRGHSIFDRAFTTISLNAICPSRSGRFAVVAAQTSERLKVLKLLDINPKTVIPTAVR